MARLLKYQMEHAKQKLNQIAWKHEGAKPQSDYEMPDAIEFCEGIVAGKIKLTPLMIKYGCKEYLAAERGSRYNGKSPMAFIRRAYYAKEQDAADKELNKKMQAWDKRRAVIAAAQSRAIDKLVLGGEEAALAAIEEFRNMTF